ncbi:hypothetical protein [Crateriforma spongiae]|uniref:hypothetical protein n=1 Tax=Crateriforma spongiae TaxID=2724528 RepID=UPI001447C0C3|nr:hypothetical protein [Crateriforma spongiae]
MHCSRRINGKCTPSEVAAIDTVTTSGLRNDLFILKVAGFISVVRSAICLRPGLRWSDVRRAEVWQYRTVLVQPS